MPESFRIGSEIRPKRYRCLFCEGGPTTTPRCAWYDPYRPHTTAFEQEVLTRLVHSTVADVSRQLDLGSKAVEGIMDHRLRMRWTRAPSPPWRPWGATRWRCARGTMGIHHHEFLKG